jgi:hypothetical protein
MYSADLMKLGIGLVICSTFVYAATWAFVIRKPSCLIGNISILWFKGLLRVLTFGLVILLLAAADRIVCTYLFWRR